MILIFSNPTVGEGVPQIAHSHTKSFGLYRKIHVKTGVDQGLRGASLQATSTADLFLLLRAPWTLQSKKRSEGGREEEEKSSKNSKNSKRTNDGMSKRGAPFYRLGIRVSPREGHQESMPKPPFGIPKNFK